MKFNRIHLQMIIDKTFNYNNEVIKNAKDIVKFINKIEQISLLPEENIYCICLDNQNKINAYSKIAKGCSSFCNLDIKSIFKTVLLSNSIKFILIHNHPSGNSKPSNKDYEVTEKLKKASKILEIDFLDHIVIGEDSFSSCFECKA